MTTKAAAPTAGKDKGGKSDIKKVVLAYSGGLDTSIILKWLQETYGCEVVTFTADLGQGEELGPAREKALMLGIKPENIFIEDLREEFVRDYVFPMFRANALYEGVYLLGTSIARPLIAKKQIEIARKIGRRRGLPRRHRQGQRPGPLRADLLRARARHQDHRAVARVGLQEPRRPDRLRRDAPDPDRQGQGGRGAVLGRRQPAALVVRGQGAGGPGHRSAADRLSAHHLADGRARQGDRHHASASTKGDAVSIDGKTMSPATLLTALNDLGHDNGIGRLDLVENRFVGMKSRGVYETPGGTILLAAHRAIESITLDRGAGHLKDELMPRYAELIYNGFWFSPEREMLQALIDKSQEHVEGEVTLKLYKGNVIVIGRESAEVALFVDARHLRGRPGRLRPEGRRRASSSSTRCACGRWRQGTRGSERLFLQWLGAFVQTFEILRIDIMPAAAAAGALLHDSEVFEMTKCGLNRRLRNFQPLGGGGHSDERLPL